MSTKTKIISFISQNLEIILAAILGIFFGSLLAYSVHRDTEKLPCSEYSERTISEIPARCVMGYLRDEKK